jgi:hypothetical protein
MSSGYTVLPYNIESWEWLCHEFEQLAKPAAENRNPTPHEIFQVIASLGNLEVERSIQSESLYLLISDISNEEPSAWVLLVIINYDGGKDFENHPHEIYFEKGWSTLIIRIMASLSRFSGALVLVPNSGQTPVVISPTTTSEEIANLWKK